MPKHKCFYMDICHFYMYKYICILESAILDVLHVSWWLFFLVLQSKSKHEMCLVFVTKIPLYVQSLTVEGIHQAHFHQNIFNAKRLKPFQHVGIRYSNTSTEWNSLIILLHLSIFVNRQFGAMAEFPLPRLKLITSVYINRYI